MRVTRVFLGVFFLLAFLCCFEAVAQSPAPAGPAAPATASVSGPVAQLAEMSFDFGELMEGREYAHDFKVKNVGTAPLEIKKVVPG